MMSVNCEPCPVPPSSFTTPTSARRTSSRAFSSMTARRFFSGPKVRTSPLSRFRVCLSRKGLYSTPPFDTAAAIWQAWIGLTSTKPWPMELI
jgi:hypothetical protein